MVRPQSEIVHRGGQRQDILLRLAEVLTDLGSTNIDDDLVSVIGNRELAQTIGREIFCARRGLVRIEGPFFLEQGSEKTTAELLRAVQGLDVEVDDVLLTIPQQFRHLHHGRCIPGTYALVWFRQPCSPVAAHRRILEMGLQPGCLRALAAFIQWCPRERACHVVAVGQDDSCLTDIVRTEFKNLPSFPLYLRTLEAIRHDIPADSSVGYLVWIRPAPKT